MDLYLPHDAAVRGGKTTPVYIDIHGGGFVYGYKELNRNFCAHLADEGFAVFSLNYRLCPAVDMLGQLEDIECAFSWMRSNAGRYPIDADSIFVTGDSAGGTLGLYALVLERCVEAANDFGVKPSGLHIKGAALVSGLLDLAARFRLVDSDIKDTDSEDYDLKLIAPTLYGRFRRSCARWAGVDYVAREIDLPPLFLNTSSDDFLEAHSLRLAAALATYNRDFEIHDRHVGKAQTLGHVYPVCMSWLEESRETLRQIRDFSYALL